MINVVCLYTGDKYSIKYVEILYAMLCRHLTHKVIFHCITDKAQFAYHPGIHEIVIPPELLQEGWWNKLLLFNQKFHKIQGDILYLDLDIVIVDNIDCFVDDGKGLFCIIQDFNRTRKLEHYNSSIMKFPAGVHDFLWDEYLSWRAGTLAGTTARSFPGDQDFITDRIRSSMFLHPYQDGWTWSYKWNNKPAKGKIAVFHGKPDPHEKLAVDWIKNNWRYGM